jgi:hypothetical protein
MSWNESTLGPDGTQKESSGVSQPSGWRAISGGHLQPDTDQWDSPAAC